MWRAIPRACWMRCASARLSSRSRPPPSSARCSRRSTRFSVRGEAAMKQSIGHLMLAGAIAVTCADGTANAQQKVFELSSTTFKDGQMMPVKVANSRANDPRNPNCVGENVSPQLSWINPPPGTRSFAFLMIDPEGRGGGGVNHWVAYGIPADVTGFAEGEVSKESPKYVGGASLMKLPHYFGPCTPPGP